MYDDINKGKKNFSLLSNMIEIENKESIVFLEMLDPNWKD